MLFQVKPTQKLKGSIQLPASKSYSIRAWMIAACGGKSKIINPSDCDDALVARDVAKLFGSKITKAVGDAWKIAAFARKVNLKNIHVKESGTTLRFVLPLCALYSDNSIIKGSGTLVGRPNQFLTKAMRAMGVKIRGKGRQESVPIKISGGKLRAGKINIDGSLSSQFISALLIAAPVLDENTHVHLTGSTTVSSDYITMTTQVLKEAGVTVRKKGARDYVVRGGQKFKGLCNFAVPSDYGLAAFHLAAAALTDSNVTLKGAFRDEFVQADGHIIPLIKKMGVKFTKTSKAIKLKGPFRLKGGRFSLKDCPDLVPIMAVLALFARGKTELVDIAHARAKESDRIGDLRKELLKVGAKITERRDALIIHPQETYKSNVLLDPHNDHRLAMAFSVLGLKIGVRIKNMQCCAKSYPGFPKDFKRLGAKVRG